jgi:hypothetical protein
MPGLSFTFLRTSHPVCLVVIPCLVAGPISTLLPGLCCFCLSRWPWVRECVWRPGCCPWALGVGCCLPYCPIRGCLSRLATNTEMDQSLYCSVVLSLAVRFHTNIQCAAPVLAQHAQREGLDPCTIQCSCNSIDFHPCHWDAHRAATGRDI